MSGLDYLIIVWSGMVARSLHLQLLVLTSLGLAWALPAAGQPPQPPPGAKVIEIRFMGPNGPIAGAFDDVVRAFERHSIDEHKRDPSKPVYRILSGQDANSDMVADPTRFLLSVAGGVPPDVVKFDRYAIAEWAGRNAFYPLDEYLRRDADTSHPGALQVDNFYSNVWAEASYQGRPYAIPTDVDARALYYNKDLLRRAGFVDPATGDVKPPATWEELQEYAVKLTQRDELGRLRAIGFAPNYGNSWLYMFGWMAGAEFMTADGRRAQLNHPAVVRALGYMTRLYDSLGGYAAVEVFRATFQGGFLDPMISGQVAMKIDSSGSLSFFTQYGRDLDFGVVPAPMPADRLAAGASPISWSGGFSLAIPVNARQRDAAWEFIRFATSDEGFRIYTEGDRDVAESMGWLFVPTFTPKPHLNEELCNQYVFHDARMPQRIKDAVKTFLDLLPDSRFRPITPVGQLMWNQQVTAMEEALYHRKTPQQALDYANGVVQRDLDRILAPPTGTPMNWTWFFTGYGVLLVAVFASVYAWDTSLGFRRVFSRLRRRRGAAVVSEGDLIEGARGGYFRQQWLAGFLCTLPWILGFIIFGAGPILFSIVMSFCDYDVLSPPRFIGLENFRILFREDELALKSFLNTLIMMLRIPVNMAAGLALALMLNQSLKGIPLFRALFYLPAIVPAVAGYILWIWIFNPQGGPLNTMLGHLGIVGPHWLQDAKWAKPSIAIMSLWGTGGSMIIWLAGLRNINPQLYEAASIDGAGDWRQFLHITLPQLSPYIFFNLIMGLIEGFKIFDEAFIMTRGGPVNSTLFYVYHLFNNAFRYGHMGYACALAWILFLCIIGFTFLQMRMARRWVHYEH